MDFREQLIQRYKLDGNLPKDLQRKLVSHKSSPSVSIDQDTNLGTDTTLPLQIPTNTHSLSPLKSPLRSPYAISRNKAIKSLNNLGLNFNLPEEFRLRNDISTKPQLSSSDIKPDNFISDNDVILQALHDSRIAPATKERIAAAILDGKCDIIEKSVIDPESPSGLHSPLKSRQYSKRNVDSGMQSYFNSDAEYSVQEPKLLDDVSYTSFAAVRNRHRFNNPTFLQISAQPASIRHESPRTRIHKFQQSLQRKTRVYNWGNHVYPEIRGSSQWKNDNSHYIKTQELLSNQREKLLSAGRVGGGFGFGMDSQHQSSIMTVDGDELPAFMPSLEMQDSLIDSITSFTDDNSVLASPMVVPVHSESSTFNQPNDQDNNALRRRVENQANNSVIAQGNRLKAEYQAKLREADERMRRAAEELSKEQKNNLIQKVETRKRIHDIRKKLLSRLREKNDPNLAIWIRRLDHKTLENFMSMYQGYGMTADAILALLSSTSNLPASDVKVDSSQALPSIAETTSTQEEKVIASMGKIGLLNESSLPPTSSSSKPRRTLSTPLNDEIFDESRGNSRSGYIPKQFGGGFPMRASRPPSAVVLDSQSSLPIITGEGKTRPVPISSANDRTSLSSLEGDSLDQPSVSTVDTHLQDVSRILESYSLGLDDKSDGVKSMKSVLSHKSDTSKIVTDSSGSNQAALPLLSPPSHELDALVGKAYNSAISRLQGSISDIKIIQPHGEQIPQEEPLIVTKAVHKKADVSHSIEEQTKKSRVEKALEQPFPEYKRPQPKALRDNKPRPFLAL